MATPISGDMKAMGIGVDEPEAVDLGLDTDDPDIAALIASFEQRTPNPADLLAQIERSSQEGQEGQETPDPSGEQLPPPAPGSEAPAPSGELPPPTGEPQPQNADGTPVQPPASWVVDLGNGASAELDQETARRLVALGNWANQLPENTRTAMNAVEQGQAVAIPRDEYQAYAAWKAAGAKPGTAGAPGTSTPPPFDPEDADPATLALWQEVQSLRAQQDQQFQNDTARLTADQNARIQQVVAQKADVFEKEWVSAGAEMQLTPDEINRALQYAGETLMIQQVNREMATFSPTGSVLQEADPAAIARVVLDRAVYAIPSLREKAIQATVDARLERERADIIRTNEKKSRAGSLASAPSAATTNGRDVRLMTPQEREAAIANELRAAMQ